MPLFKEGFFNRLSSSVDRVLFGLDLIVALGFTLIIYYLPDAQITERIAVQFFDSATPLLTTLIIVIVTSVSILVSLSNSNAIKQLKRKRLYGTFLFTFEFTAILALITVLVSIVAQTLSSEHFLFYTFTFLFSYTILAVATVISRLITYGDKIAQISLANDLPDDLGDKVTEIHPTGTTDDVGEQATSKEEASEEE